MQNMLTILDEFYGVLEKKTPIKLKNKYYFHLVLNPS